jgi:hypothetical protein
MKYKNICCLILLLIILLNINTTSKLLRTKNTGGNDEKWVLLSTTIGYENYSYSKMNVNTGNVITLFDLNQIDKDGEKITFYFLTEGEQLTDIFEDEVKFPQSKKAPELQPKKFNNKVDTKIPDLSIKLDMPRLGYARAISTEADPITKINGLPLNGIRYYKSTFELPFCNKDLTFVCRMVNQECFKLVFSPYTGTLELSYKGSQIASAGSLPDFSEKVKKAKYTYMVRVLTDMETGPLKKWENIQYSFKTATPGEFLDQSEILNKDSYTTCLNVLRKQETYGELFAKYLTEFKTLYTLFSKFNEIDFQKYYQKVKGKNKFSIKKLTKDKESWTASSIFFKNLKVTVNNIRDDFNKVKTNTRFNLLLARPSPDFFNNFEKIEKAESEDMRLLQNCFFTVLNEDNFNKIELFKKMGLNCFILKYLKFKGEGSINVAYDYLEAILSEEQRKVENECFVENLKLDKLTKNVQYKILELEADELLKNVK